MTDPVLWVETPLVYSKRISQRIGANAWLKLETFQPAQSFKSRGISLFIQQRLLQNPSARFAIASSGNAALGCSSRLSGSNAVRISVITQLESDGAKVEVIGSEYYDALQAAKKFVDTNNDAVMVPSFDDPVVWKGHATMVHEIKSQLSIRMAADTKADAICCSVGGGGLLAGCMIGADELGWNDTIFLSTETFGADCFHKTLAANKDNASAATNPEIITIPSITSRASSLGSRSPGVEITKMAHRHDVRPTSMCDEMAMYAAVQLADEEKLQVEIACGACLVLAYFPSVLAQVVPEWKLLDSKSPAWEYVQPKTNRRNIVFVVCGGAKITARDLEAWSEELGVNLEQPQLDERFWKYKVGKDPQ